MQTFLPYPDFAKSASVLDRQRLGKQRVETLQVIKALSDINYGWRNHPAVKMWRGHRGALLDYQRAVCAEWTSRGYKDTCYNKSAEIIAEIMTPSIEAVEFALPDWMGDEPLHQSHRSNLLRKSPEYYQELFEDGLSPELDYVWPVQ